MMVNRLERVPSEPLSEAAFPIVDEPSSGPARQIKSPLYRSRTKRAFDIVASLGLIAFLLPLFLMLIMLVRVDGGPALFRHRRIGAAGGSFNCLKFRTMVVNSEQVLARILGSDPQARAEWGKDFKLKNDPRITPIGKFLRKTSLDELPQLFNVLAGDMSLVGPRPIVAAEIEKYDNRFQQYCRCRPGITGLWQVSGRNDVSYSTRVSLDCRYAAEWSFWKDMHILSRTVVVVTRQSGAY